MIESAEIKRTFTGKYKNETVDSTQHQCQMVENDDLQDIQGMMIPGIQYNPPVDSRGFVAHVTRAWRVLVGVFDKVARYTLATGELIIYSVQAGAVSAYIHFKSGGNVEINGSGGHAVQYEALLTAFNELKSDFNTFVGVYNSHNHGGAGPTPTGATSSADMTPSKIDSIQVP